MPPEGVIQKMAAQLIAETEAFLRSRPTLVHLCGATPQGVVVTSAPSVRCELPPGHAGKHYCKEIQWHFL